LHNELETKAFSKNNIHGKLFADIGVNLYRAELKSTVPQVSSLGFVAVVSNPLKTIKDSGSFAFKLGVGLGKEISEFLEVALNLEYTNKGSVSFGKQAKCMTCDSLTKELKITDQSIGLVLSLAKNLV